LAVIALLVYAGVALWYGRVEDRLQRQEPVKQEERAPTPVLEERQPAPAGDDYQIILTRNIFKAASESGGRPGGSSQTDVEDLAETKLSLVLLGTVTGDKGDSRAIIRDEKTKLEDLYQVGSEVQGAVISRISRGKVVLQVSGREEVLTIKDPDNGDQGQGGTARMDTRMPSMAPNVPSREVENKVPEAQPRRRISFRDPGSVTPATEKPVTPVPEDGQPEKVEVQPLPADETPLPDAKREGAAEHQGQ
jgi:type II secretory pathway component PulC